MSDPRPPAEAPRLGDRSLFSGLSARAYLSHSAISPPPDPVREAVHQLLARYCEAGIDAYAEAGAQRDTLRAALAGLIGAGQPADVAFVQSTTQGVITVARSLPWRRGQTIVLFRGEFPANVTPWQRAAADFGLEVVMLEAAAFGADADAGLAELERCLNSREVRLVAVSAVQFQTGLAMPLQQIGALAHAHGAEIFVDGIQAVGAMPLDVGALDVDYLAGGAHKWLMGIEGAGYLYVHPRCQPSLSPAMAGWLSHEEPLGFLFDGPGLLRYDRPLRRGPGVIEAGSQSALSFAALRAAVELIAALRPSAIFEHIQRYHDALEPALLGRGFASRRDALTSRRSGILAVTPPDGVSLAALRARLNEAGVIVTSPDGVLRIAPHWPNGLDEVGDVVSVVDEALRALGKK